MLSGRYPARVEFTILFNDLDVVPEAVVVVLLRDGAIRANMGERGDGAKDGRQLATCGISGTTHVERLISWQN